MAKSLPIRIYEFNTTSFNNNGLGVLFPSSAIIERNLEEYTYSLTISHPLDEYGKWELLQEDRIIKANEQLFRIKYITKTLTSIEAYCEHVFFDLNSNFIEDTNIVSKNGNLALNQILDSMVYEQPITFTATSDIAITNNSRLVRKNVLNAILGSDDNSFINRWGGELDIDGFTFEINTRIGQNNGYKILYGKNLTGLNAKFDMTNVCTVIRPVGFDGIELPDDDKYVYSQYVNNYALPIIREYTYEDVKWKGSPNYQESSDESDTAFDTLEEAQAELRRRAELEFTDNKIDIPSTTYDINFIELSQTEEYKEYQALAKINIGDDVTITHKRLGIDIPARCISYKYNCLTSNFDEVTLGYYNRNFFSKTSDLINNDDWVSNIELVQQLPDRLNAFLQQAKDQATEIIMGGFGGYVYYTPNAIYIMDTDDINTAQKIWVFNVNGLGYSSTGINGTFETAITNDGSIVADFVNTGILNAQLVKSGILESQNGASWINMETGDFNLADKVSYENGVFQISVSSGDITTDDGKTLDEKLDDLEGKITQGSSGEDGYTVLLTNENYTFIAEHDGSISRSQETTTNVLVYQGITSVDFTIGTLPTVSGLTLSSTGNTITIEANTGTDLSDNGTFDIIINVGEKSFTKSFSWSKSLKGEDGEIGYDGQDAKSIDIIASSQIFKSTDGGATFNPSTITLDKFLQNTSFSKWQYYYGDGGSIIDPVEVAVTGVSLNKSSLSFSGGGTEQLIATITPSNATNQKLTWESSNSKVASVTQDGIVTYVSSGTSVITVTTNDGGFTATCNVTCSAQAVTVTSVSLSHASATLNYGDTLQLSATVLPSNATNKNVTWSTSSSSIATVSTSGLVTYVGEGVATITVKTEEGGYTATCTITCNAKVETISVTGISLSSTSLTLDSGGTSQLTATVSPSNATDKSVTWSSSKPTVATVSNKGLVSYVNGGTSVITVTTTDGGYTATCNVTCNAPATSETYGGLVVSKTTMSFDSGSSSTFTVKLDTKPSVNQTVSITSDNNDITISPSILTFAPDNYNIVQNVLVSATTEGSGTITLSSTSVSSKTIAVTINSAPIATEGDTGVADHGTYLQLGNRTVGYKPVTSESFDSSATVVSTASALTSAISSATAGTTIYVRAGEYTFSNGLTINKTGTSSNPIIIKNYPSETPVITGSKINLSGSYYTFEGFKIQDLENLDWDTCVVVTAGTSNLTLRNLEITNIKCVPITESTTNGCNPLVLYGDGSTPISNILIENCYIHDCDTGWSEAVTCNGNVTDVIIKNCCITNNQNIGIDLAGNFSWTGTVGDSNNQARNIIVENNLVMNCQSPYATSAGIYCDGSRDNTIRYNVVYNAQCGLELGAEEGGATVQNFKVYGNLFVSCGRSIGVGAYLETGATHQNTYIYNNTIVCTNDNTENYGLYVERTSNLNFVNNVIYGASGTTLYSNTYGASVTLTNNCWYKSSGSKPSADSTGIFADPLFINNTSGYAGNYNLQDSSPCIDQGTTASSDYMGSVDINNNMRINNKVDIGAFEWFLNGDASTGSEGSTDVYGSIVVSETSLSVNATKTTTFTVKLNQAPTNNQTVSLSVSDSNCSINKSSLTFTSSNYSTEQTVTVTGVTKGTSAITLTSSNVGTVTVNVTILGSDEVVKTNILPKFDTWTLSDGSATVTSMSDYSFVITNSAWNGLCLWGTSIVTSGDNITIGCESISDNCEFYISDANGNAMVIINSSTLSSTVTLSGSTPYDIYITSSDSNQMSITNAYIYNNAETASVSVMSLNDIESDNTSGSSNGKDTIQTYATEGWNDVVSGQDGLTIGINNELIIDSTSPLFTSTVTTLTFRAISTDGLYDVITIVKLYDVTDLDIEGTVDDAINPLIESNKYLTERLDTMFSDGVITSYEKSTLSKDLKEIDAQYEDLTKIVTLYNDSAINGVYNEYKNAYDNLHTILDPCLETMDEDTIYSNNIINDAFYQYGIYYSHLRTAIDTYVKDNFDITSATITALSDSVDIAIAKSSSNEENLNTISKHMTFSDEGWLELYATTNGEEGRFKTQITNEKLAFVDNNVEVAYLSNQQLYINDAEVENTLRIGNIVITSSDKGGIIFRYEEE